MSVNYSSAQTAGDLNVVVVGWNDTTAKVQSVADSAGNTYFLAVGPTVGTGLQQSIYYAGNIRGGSNTVTVTFNQAAAYPDVRILEYRGVTTLDVTAGASGSSSTPSSGSATTRNANELIFGANIVATLTNAPGNGFTSRVITSPDGDIAEDKVATAVGSNSATATLSSAGPWVMQMVGFSAGSGVAPTATTVSPNTGPSTGGTVVTITGANFTAGAAVTVGTASATNVVVANSTTITAKTPPGSKGAATVKITNSSGQSVSLANAFTYTASSAMSTPTFSPAGGTYTAAQSVTISDATSGGTIYYTTNGTAPTTSSTKYTGPISVSATETIKAIAVESGYTNSAVATAAYTISSSAAKPAFSPGPGTYTSAQTVTISDATSGATIYYTTNGSAPTTSSTKYTGPISVSATETVEAIAVASGYTNSAVATAAYTINSVLSTPTFSPTAGTFTSVQSVTISDASTGSTIYYTTNGAAPTTSSTIYSGPLTVSASETIEAIAVKSGYTNSAVATATYSIAAAQPTFSVAAGTYTAAQSVAISDTTPGATIYYTTNDSMPTTSSTKYTGPISVSSTETISAIAVATGYAASPEAVASYTISSAHTVNLSWDAPSSSADPVAGYNIYRATGASSSFQLLNSSTDAETTYVDSTAQSSTAYTYYVESVDSSGNQSGPSNQVSVTIP